MYNSYLNNGYGQSYPYYGQNNYNAYPNVQMGQQSTPMQAQQPVQKAPFKEVRYGTLDEAKAYVVFPNEAIMFINRNLSEFYIKSANSMGEPSFEAFKYSPITAKDTEPNIDTTQYVKQDEIKGFITKDDIKNFITADDLKSLQEKIGQLEKKIDISKMLKGEGNNGK